MTRLRVLTALTVVMVVLAASQWGFASSITLTSSSGGVYNYGLMLEPFETVNFNPNATITLSGLSGVTGGSSSSSLGGFTVSSVTPSSVVFENTTGGGFGFVQGSLPGTTGTLVVDSSVLTLGTIDFSMQTANEGTVSGMTEGPVGAATVPEPSGLVLLGTTLLGLVGLALRKASR
jgi:hypothetical protein